MEGLLELELEEFTSAQLAELIIAAGVVLRQRETRSGVGSKNPRQETESRQDAEEVPSGSAQPGGDGDAAGYSSQPRPQDGPEELPPQQKRKAPPPAPPPDSRGVPMRAPGDGGHVHTREKQPYSNCGTTGRVFSLYPEGVPSPRPPPPKASSTAPQSHATPVQGDALEARKQDLIRSVRLLLFIKYTPGVEHGWFFALQLQMNFDGDSIERRRRELLLILHPDKSDTVFKKIFSDEEREAKEECQRRSREAFHFADDAIKAALQWLKDNPSLTSGVDRKRAFGNRPAFELFHDGFLPPFFRSYHQPYQCLWKAPPPGFVGSTPSEPPYRPPPRPKYPPGHNTG